MAILRSLKRTAGVLTGLGVGTLAYLGASTTIISPIPADDPIWGSNSYSKYNPHRNPPTQDICVKRIPLRKIKPELLEKEGDLALELCRGVWGGLGYRLQRSYLSRKYHDPSTSSQLWTVDQLTQSSYEPGTQLTDHFEVVEKTPSEIVMRAGDSPLKNPGPRDADGLFAISATIDIHRQEAVLGLKSCFFTSKGKVEGMPMPVWIELLHRWYSRVLLEMGSWRVTR